MSNVDIYTILSSKPHNTYYLDLYFKFIQECRQANSLLSKEDLGYTEQHHICPKANDLFPEFKFFKEFPWNKAILTMNQHYTAHELLWKTYGGSQTYAFHKMQYLPENRKRELQTEKIDVDVLMQLKTDHRKLRSIKWKENNPNNNRELSGANNPMYGSSRCGVENPFYGKTHSDETKRKISNANSGRKASEETKKILSDMRKGIITGKTLEGKFIKIHTDDPRFLSGEIGISKAVKYKILDPNGILYETMRIKMKIKELGIHIMSTDKFQINEWAELKSNPGWKIMKIL